MKRGNAETWKRGNQNGATGPALRETRLCCRFVLAGALLVLGGCGAEKPVEPISQQRTVADEPLVDVRLVDPRIIIDLRYATTNNFTKQQLYPVTRALLRESVARRLSRVQERLMRQGLGLDLMDAYRPLSVQKKMWELVPDERYVANPAKGSRHNRGAAVDVTLVNTLGEDREMPSEFDDFSEKAHRDYQGCSEKARKNRAILEVAMESEGFIGLPTEWWHFDAPDWKSFPVLDVPLDSRDIGRSRGRQPTGTGRTLER